MSGQFVVDQQGKEVISKLDEATLKEMALIGGGKFIRIQDSNDNLNAIVSAVTSKEKKKLDSQLVIRRKARFPLFIGLGLVLILLGNWAIPRLPIRSPKASS